MASSIIILRETLNRLTQDHRIRPDDPLLINVKQQIADFEAAQKRLEDDIQESFEPLFAILDQHPQGEKAAEEYLKRKKAQRENEKRIATQRRETFEKNYKEEVEILLLKLRNAQQGPYTPFRSVDVQQIQDQINQKIAEWNNGKGNRCDVCSQIQKMSVSGQSCMIDRHSYWKEGRDYGMGSMPDEFHPCTRNRW